MIMKNRAILRMLSLLLTVILLVTAFPILPISSATSDAESNADLIFTAKEIYAATKDGVWGDKYGCLGFDEVQYHSKNHVEYVTITSQGGAGLSEAYFHLFTTPRDVAPVIAIKYRTRNASSRMEIFSDSVNKKVNGASNVGFNITVDGSWHLATVDLAESIEKYDGKTANYLRLDFLNSNNMPKDAYVDFAYIGFFDSVAEAEAYDATVNLDPVYVDASSGYTQSTLQHWSSLDMLNGMGENGATHFSNRGGNSKNGTDAIYYGGETFDNNYLVFSGWSVVDGGISKYVYSADYGKTWHDVKYYGTTGASSVDNSHAYVKTAQNQLGGVTFSSNSGKNSGYQCAVGTGVDCAGIAADLSKYAGQSVDVTFAAVPVKDTSTLVVLDFIEDVFVGERPVKSFNKFEYSDNNDDIITNAAGLTNGVEAYYTDSTRVAYAVENMNAIVNYSLIGGGESKITSITNKSGAAYVSDTMGVYVRMNDGKTYVASNYTMSPRTNIFRLGYYYYESHLMDNDFVNGGSVQKSLAFNMNDFTKYNTNFSTQPTINDGVLSFTITGILDPYIYADNLSYIADDYNTITFSVRSEDASTLDILFLNKGSTSFSTSKAKSRIAISNDGEWHTYSIDTRSMVALGYTGEIAGLRFDFNGLTDTTVEIKDIKVENISYDSVPLTFDRIMHAYSNKLHQELHVVAYEDTADINAIGIITEIQKNTVEKLIVKDKNGLHSTTDGVDWASAEYIGFDIKGAGIFGYIIPADGNSGDMTVTLEGDSYVIVQEHRPDGGKIFVPVTDTGNDFRMGQRIYTDESHSFEAFLKEAENERHPLTTDNIAIDINDTPQAKFKGYDYLRGAYYFILMGASNFTPAYYDYPNKHYELSFGIKGDGIDRDIYVFAHASSGSLECAALLDVNDMMLPVALEVCKNFSEGEEPVYNCGDNTYGDTVFPMVIGGEENKYITLLNLYQNWGQYPLKQISSIGYYVPYYHLSTGVTETNCISQYSTRAKNSELLPDHRGMSAPFWNSQPQHYNAGHHTFLTYRDSEGNFIGNEYVNDTINSYGPTYAEINMNYVSDDGKIAVSLNHMEMPQTDENRGYYEIEYTVLEDVTVNNFREDFAIYTMSGFSYYKYLGYLDSTSNCKVAEMQAVGLAPRYFVLGPYYPYFDLYYMENVTAGYGNLAFLIESSSITIGGAKSNAKFALKEYNQTVSLTLDIDESVTLKAGDSIKIKAIIMPWGGGWKQSQVESFAESLYSLDKKTLSDGDVMYHVNNDQNVRRVRVDSLIKRFKATAVDGCEVDSTYTFLPTVHTTNGKSASFTLSGGNDHSASKSDAINVTLLAKGFDYLGVPKFEELIDGEWVEFTVSSANTPDKTGNSHTYDGYAVTYEDGKYNYSFVTTISNGKSRTFRISVDEAPQRGLEYESLAGGEGLAIVGGAVCNGNIINIPENYGGTPVTTISNGALIGNGVVSLTIHKGIVSIGRNNPFAGNFAGVTVYIDADNPNFFAQENKIYDKESGELIWFGSSLGDVDGNGTVSSADIVSMRSYFANYDYENDKPGAVVGSGADTNGDGITDTNDLTYLRQYFANYDYDSGKPSDDFTLGN